MASGGASAVEAVSHGTIGIQRTDVGAACSIVADAGEALIIGGASGRGGRRRGWRALPIDAREPKRTLHIVNTRYGGRRRSHDGRATQTGQIIHRLATGSRSCAEFIAAKRTFIAAAIIRPRFGRSARPTTACLGTFGRRATHRHALERIERAGLCGVTRPGDAAVSLAAARTLR